MLAASENVLDEFDVLTQSAEIEGALPRAVESETMPTGCQLIAAMVRFEKKLYITEDGHRLWAGAQTRGGVGVKGRCKCDRRRKRKTDGNPFYGKFWVGPDKKATIQAHVFAAFFAGKIPTLRVPDGMHLAHSCPHGSLCVDCTRLVPAHVNLEEARTAPIRAHHNPLPFKRDKRSKRRQRKPGNPFKVSRQQKEGCTI
jgi:hypothetical protein